MITTPEEAKEVMSHSTLMLGRKQGKRAFLEALVVMQQALDKQIPVSPAVDYATEKHLYCGSCGKHLGTIDILENYRLKYCPACGQKWRETTADVEEYYHDNEIITIGDTHQ